LSTKALPPSSGHKSSN